jgi:hypothetical protein
MKVVLPAPIAPLNAKTVLSPMEAINSLAAPAIDSSEWIGIVFIVLFVYTTKVIQFTCLNVFVNNNLCVFPQ